MKPCLSVASLALALGLASATACGAPPADSRSPAETMPHLVARDMLDACLDRHGTSGQRESCIGEYSSLCMDRETGDTNTGTIQCTIEEYEAWDAKLNEVYADLYVSLNERRAATLREAQRAWFRLREADCQFEASAYQDGSMQPLVRAGCWLDHAARRTMLLLDWTESPY